MRHLKFNYQISRYAYSLMFICAVATLVACQPADGTSTGNPLVSLSMGAYTSMESPSYSPQSVTMARFCFKRLRFKMDGEVTPPDSSTDEDNIDFEIGDVLLDSSGTYLGAVELPVGTYSRVEFDLENHCVSGKSVQVHNSSGSYSSDQRITVKFEGTFVHSSAGSDLNLGVQSIISALDAVTADNQIKSALESASGDF